MNYRKMLNNLLLLFTGVLIGMVLTTMPAFTLAIFPISLILAISFALD